MLNRIIYGDELVSALKTLDSKSTPEAPFNRALIAMAAGCGLEPIELAKLSRSHVFRADYEVFERSYIPASVSASGKDRLLGFKWPLLREVLAEYRQFIFDNKIHAYGSEMDLERPMFCRSDGTPFPAWSNGDNRTASRQMSKLVQSLIDQTSLVGTGVTPKSLRHSFVVALYEAGIRNDGSGKENQLSEMTGYSSDAIGKILLRAPSRYHEPLNQIYSVKKRNKRPL